jgi:hypothetical protein
MERSATQPAKPMTPTIRKLSAGAPTDICALCGRFMDESHTAALWGEKDGRLMVRFICLECANDLTTVGPDQ